MLVVAVARSRAPPEPFAPPYIHGGQCRTISLHLSRGQVLGLDLNCFELKRGRSAPTQYRKQPRIQMLQRHYSADVTAMITPMAIMQLACRKNNAKRSVVAALVGGITICVTVCPIRAPNMVTARPSMARLWTLVATSATTIAAYTGRFSTQFMCARMARWYQSLPCGRSARHSAMEARPVRMRLQR